MLKPVVIEMLQIPDQLLLGSTRDVEGVDDVGDPGPCLGSFAQDATPLLFRLALVPTHLPPSSLPEMQMTSETN